MKRFKIYCVKGFKGIVNLVTPKSVAVFFTGLFSVTLAPLLLLANYVYPCADDYTFGSRCHFIWVETHSLRATIWQAMKGAVDLFYSWAGCVSSSFFMILQPAVFGEKAYRITPYLMIGLVSVGTTCFLYVLGKRLLKGSGWYVQSIAMIFLIMVIQCAPGPNQAYFWYNGAVHYTLMYGFLMFLYSTVIVSLLEDNQKKKIGCCIIASILSFIVASGNYLTALNGILMSILLLLGLFITKNFRKNILLLVPLCFYYIMFALSVLAPGNKVRESVSIGMPPIKAILVSFYYLFNYCFGTWMNWMILCMIAIIVVLFWNMVYNIKFQFPYPILVVAVLMGLAAAMMTPCLFGMGNIEAGRISTVIYTVFLLYLIICVCYVTGWIQKHCFQIKKSYDFSFQSRLVVLFCIGLLLFGTIITMIPEPQSFTSSEAVRELLSGEAKAYAQTMENRAIAYHSGEKELVVEPLEVYPILLFVSDIKENPLDWENQGVCRFFDLTSVRVDKKK